MLLNESKTMNRRQLPTMGRVLAVMAFGAVFPAMMRADCVPSVPNGWVVDFAISSHRNNGLVAYGKGTLSASSFLFASHLSTDSIPIYFSDRYWYPVAPPPWTDPQPQFFSYNQTDSLGVLISKATYPTPSINVTLTSNSWGGTKTSFTATCDAATNLLYGFVDNSAVVINFGTISNPIPR